MTTENEELENKEAEEAEALATAEEQLNDAISNAIDEATPDDVLAANKETAETETGAEQTPEELVAAEKVVDEKAAEETAAAEAFEKLTPEEQVAAKKATDEKVAEEAAAAEAFEKLTPEEKVAAEKAADEKTAEEAAEKADPINDPIPESTKAETATRIRSLIDLTKDATARADDADERTDEIVAAITDAGADPAQYANTLGFLKLYNSTDPAMRKQALTAAEGVVRELRIELGEGTVDLLDNHDDLKAKVEAGTLEQSDAIEIATSREKAVLDTARTDAADTATATEKQTLANIEIGKTQLTKLETLLQASDPDYAALRPTFIAMLRPALRKAHPTEYGEVAQEIYAAVKQANPVVEKPAPVVPEHTPLRPHGSGGGSSDKDSTPATALAAVDAALGAM